MYRNIYYDPRAKKVHLWTWDDQGKRIETVEPFSPYIYIESNSTKDAVSIYNTNLRKIVFPSQFDRRKYVNESGIKRIFYNLKADQQYLIDKFGHLNESPDFSKNPLKIFYIDIEIYSIGTFPVPTKANDAINLITVFDSLAKVYHTFALEKPYTPKLPNNKYYQFQTEAEMLQAFVNFWAEDYPDVVSGWNSEYFDIPYIINRINNVLGDDWSKKLSPVGQLFYRDDIRQKFGKTQGRWYINGISCADYLEVYKTFSRGEQSSYRLDNIAKVELGEGKINLNSPNLAKLSDSNWEGFVDYNIQDVRLLVKLEEKLRYLHIMRMIAYKGLGTFEAAMGKVSIVTGAVALQAQKHGKIIPTFTHENMGNYAGGFVKDITPGMREGVVTFDANSLYPNTLISLNLSPETKIGKIVSKTDTEVEVRLVNGKVYKLSVENFLKFVEKEKIAISKAKILFTQKQKGIIPEFVDNLYAERVRNRQEMNKIKYSQAHCKKGSETYEKNELMIEQLDIMQYTLKILLNSIYGVFANKHGPLYDIDLASSITLTGQAAIKQASEILNQYAKDRYSVTEEITHYNDTDSTHISLKPILDKLEDSLQTKDSGEITPKTYELVNELNAHLNTEIEKWGRKSLNSLDPRFVFKREAICAVGIYEAKKHYILHIKDKGEDKPLACDEIKYVGVEVAKSTFSDSVKDLIKSIVETIVHTKDRKVSTDAYRQAYAVFKNLPVEEIAFRSSINDYEKYAGGVQGFIPIKHTPVHVKASLYYNKLLKEKLVDTVYDPINSGDKIKWIYTSPNNKYNIKCMAFIDKLPEELKEIKPDFEKMWEKTVAPAVDRLFESIQWKTVNLREEYACDLLEFFGADSKI